MASDETPTMKPARAAVLWVLTQRIIKGVESVNKQAADVLKDHCRANGLKAYRGIGYSETTQRRLNNDAARKALGPVATEACTWPVKIRTLTLPPSATPIVPTELG
jgi:hypothetical protein